MLLSQLKTGEQGVVVKVKGHGSFRRRIIEMGFVRGKTVEVLLNAPLQDPVKYRIMGYELALRREEAGMIEVITMSDVETPRQADVAEPISSGSTVVDDEVLRQAAARESRVINVALVGNPNCGKTSLFNFASGAQEHVGNYSGVTVDAKEGHCDFNGYRINLVDLPGTYSLTAYSPEELYVRRQIIDKTPDIVLNVIDASNLERNLYLTTQLIDMDLKMVCALNMYDDLERSGDRLDVRKLSELLAAPMVPTVFKTGRGVGELLQAVIDMYEGTLNSKVFRHIHINHGEYLEDAISAVKTELERNSNIRYRYSMRYLAIKLLENDGEAEKVARGLPNGETIIAVRDKASAEVRENVREDSETAMMNAKYGFINGAMQEAFFSDGKDDSHQLTKLIDRLVTNRYLGFPLFFVILFVMFWVTFTLGQYPMDWIEAGVGWLGDVVKENMADGPLKALLADGVIGGVGSVIVFLPQILILYFFISLMEDSGYMARAAFIMDKVMHRMGLHGKSFIPMIMGFGCNVPAIMATRTIESRNSRLITMLVLPFMSCSARLPIYIMITGAFFAAYQSVVMLGLYALGILTAVAMSRLLKRFLIKNDDTPFVMELPPYRLPTAKAIWRHTWSKGQQYLKKMGGIILVASIIVWFLGYYPDHDRYATSMEQQEHSYLGTIGKVLEPVFVPCGFDWKLDIGLLAGVGAKEIVASTMGVIYSNEEDAHGVSLHDRMAADGITPLVALSFLVFVLLYFPCIATIAAIKSETGQWRWALLAAGYTTLVAWIAATIVYQIGLLITG